MNLKDDFDLDVEVELLAEIPYEGKEYTILFPLKDNDDELVLIVEKIGENQFIPVMDEKVLQEVYEIFQSYTEKANAA